MLEDISIEPALQTKIAEVGYISPTDVKIRDGLDRFRKEIGDVSQLADSIKSKGQIQPIVVNRNFELIVGGRRLAACIIAGVNVKYVFEDTADPVQMREWELEENLHRKNFTPAEEAQAIAEIHRIRQAKFGTSTSGRPGGQSATKTATELGVSRGTVEQSLLIDEMIKAFPQLAAAKTKSSIMKAAKGLDRLATAVTGQQKFETQIAAKQVPFKLIHGDACQSMSSLKDKSINVLCTDPLYGIEAEKLCMTIGGTGTEFNTAGYKIEDCPDKALFLYHYLAYQSFRFTTDDAHGFIFCAPEHFWTIREMFISSGWQPYIKPIIWIKREVGQCNVPFAWPSSCYEMLMYVRKGSSRLVKEGQPDWIECKPVTESLRLHQYEKPVPLIYTLLSRVAVPGNVVYDPFMGSGSTIEAATELKLFSIGVDISPEAYANAVRRMGIYTEKRLS